MKRKTPYSTKGKKPVQQTTYNWDEYFDLSMFERRPINEVTIEKWAKEMHMFFLNHPDPRYLSEFYITKNIAKTEFFSLCDKYPALGRIKGLALQIIGENIYRRSVDQKANWQAVKYSLYRHDDDFKKDSDHEVAVKQAIEPDKEVILQLQYVKDTGVPFRKIE